MVYQTITPTLMENVFGDEDQANWSFLSDSVGLMNGDLHGHACEMCNRVISYCIILQI